MCLQLSDWDGGFVEGPLPPFDVPSEARDPVACATAPRGGRDEPTLLWLFEEVGRPRIDDVFQPSCGHRAASRTCCPERLGPLVSELHPPNPGTPPC